MMQVGPPVVVAGVVEEEVEEVAGEEEVEVEVEGSQEVLAAHLGLNLQMIMLHMRKPQERTHGEDVDVDVAAGEDVEQLGLDSHRLRAEADQFQRLICWEALACLAM
jgi:TPP-dependent indolepyruvate ferredoxin oxidoreductase alpha subunit